MKLHVVIMLCDVCMLCKEWTMLWIEVAYFRSSPLSRLCGGRSLLSKGMLRFVLFMLGGWKIYEPKAAFNKTTFFARRLDLSFKKKVMKCYIGNIAFYGAEDGFGGLVVSMLASGTQVCGFKPGRSRWNFTDVKILSMPSSGGEVKESVPCPSFAACKRT